MGSVVWSRDGKRVVYSSYLGRSWNQLFLMTQDGGDPFQLTYGDYDNTNPRWSPDGSKIAYISNAGGNTSLKVIDLPGGDPTTVRATTLRYRVPRTAVTIRIVDRAGRPVGARVSVTGEDGRGFVPRDAWAHADDGFDRRERRFELTYFHTSGASTLALAPGRYVTEVTKGLEFGREVDTIIVGAEATTHRVTLSRLVDLPARGWWSGDLHVHMNYGGHYRNTPERLRFQAEAEDLHVVENLVVNKEARIPDRTYFSSDPDPVSTNGQIIKHDEEYHTSYWGHSAQIGLREFLMPNYAAYVNTAAGQQAQLQQAEVIGRGDRLHLRHRGLPRAMHRNSALPRSGDELVQPVAQVTGPAVPSTLHQGGIDLLHLPFAQHAVQLYQGAALLGDHQQTGGIPVQAMRQLEPLGLGTLRAQRFDHAVAHAAAPMHRHAGGFVDHQQRGVFVHDRQRQRLRCRPGGRRGDSHRRHADPVAGLEPVVGLDPAAVDPDLAAAQHPVDVALRHPLQAAQEEVVDALGDAFLPDFE